MVITAIIVIMEVITIIKIIDLIVLIQIGWDQLVRGLYTSVDHTNPILYVIPIQRILGKLPVVPVGDTGTIPLIPTPPAPPIFGRASRPQAGFWRWMPYVVCQFVGIGMVP
jgi:hypothetical protein